MATNGCSERERPIQLLKDVVISRVEPSSVSEHPKFLYPSVFDMMFFDKYTTTLLLYRINSTDPSAFTNFLHAFKNSLSQVLSLYYPMAGKWIPAEDAWTRKLACTDEGAVFVEAAIDNELDNVLHPDDFNPPEELLGDHAVPGFEPSSSYKASGTNEYPSLIVQVTRFECGGVALALNRNHMTLDGFGFDRFLKAWSEILSTGQTSVKPAFDRSLVVSHLDKSHILGISPGMENTDDVLSSHFRFFHRSEVPPNLCTKIFSIRQDVVDRLRQKVKEEHILNMPEGPKQFSTFECVCAQLWRCFARIPKSEKDLVSIHFPVEGRTRWSNPPLPENYVGNMILFNVLPKLPRAEVTDRPLSFAVSHIRESVAKINHQTSGELLDKLLAILKMIRDRRPTEENLETIKPVNHKGTFEAMLSSLIRFNYFYSLDFGYGGPFLYSPCPPTSAASEVTVFLLSPRPNSGNALQLYLRAASPDYMKILLEDPEFIHLVS